MFKKLKSLFQDPNAPAPAPAAKSKSAPAARAAAKAPSKPSPAKAPSGKAPVAAAGKRSAPQTASVATAAPAAAVSQAYTSKRAAEPNCVVLANHGNAIFEGTLNPQTLQPVRGTALYPSGTVLEGAWDADTGCFVQGRAVFATGTLQEQEGTWVPTTAAEAQMNEGIGVRLSAGRVRDATYRVVSTGIYAVYKHGYIRLLEGERRIPAPQAPKDIAYADLLPDSQTILGVGTFHVEKNCVKEGCVLSTTVGAGSYEVDGGNNQLKEGIFFNSMGTLSEGRYRRRTDFDNGAITTPQYNNRHVGRWQKSDGVHLALGVRTTCRTAEELAAGGVNEIHCVESGRFALVAPRRLLSGRRVAMKNNVSAEGLFCPISGGLICGVVLSNQKSDAPVVTLKPNAETCDAATRFASITGETMYGINGFRRWFLPADVWEKWAAAINTTKPEDAMRLVASFGSAGPSLTEQECLDLERAWYDGERTCGLSSGRGVVYFGDHIDEGCWTFSPTGNGGADGDVGRASFSLTREERLVETIRLKQSLMQQNHELANVFPNQVSDEQIGSFSDVPSWIELPLARHEWMVHRIDMDTMLTTFAEPNNGSVVDATTASAQGEAAGAVCTRPQRFTDDDMVNLDKAACAGDASAVQTSIGFVNVHAPLRRLVPVPLPMEEDGVQALQALGFGVRHVTRDTAMRHPLVQRAFCLTEHARALARAGLGSNEDCVAPVDNAAAFGIATTNRVAEAVASDASMPDPADDGTTTNDVANVDAPVAAQEAPQANADTIHCPDNLVDPSTPVGNTSGSANAVTSGRVVDHVVKQFLTLKEEFHASAFKRRFLQANAVPFLESRSRGESPTASSSTSALAAPSHKFGISTVVHIPLPADGDCTYEHRHSWGFVLEYLHWVGLRRSCVPLILPLLGAYRRSAHKDASESPSNDDAAALLSNLRVSDGASAFMAAVDNILEQFEHQLHQVAERVYSVHAPFATRVTVAEAAVWEHGIVCRFLGDQLSATTAACDVSMWLARRSSEMVRPPASWVLSQDLGTPSSVVEADGEGPRVALYQVDPASLEYCDVHNCLYNMQFPSVWTIVKLERVQNLHLYDRYVAKRRQIGKECRAANTVGHHGCNEHRWLAHGTRGVEPMTIARQGFDHRYSAGGLFGRAAYFAYDPVYSHSYRHETGVAKEAQMFLATVTAGNIELRDKIDKEIKHPKQNCSSIDGPLTDRFRGLMVYDLDQAYPAYLVTYKYT